MSDVLYAATRKGLFTLKRSGPRRWKIAKVDFLGDNVSVVLPAADGWLYAALELGHFGVKLRRSKDGGRSWEERAVPAFPEEEKLTLKKLWALAQAGGRLWAGTIPGGLWSSDDGGASWRLNEGLWDHPSRKSWMGGGYDEPGLHSICVNPRDPSDIVAGVSTGGVWGSLDGGRTWEPRTKGLFAVYMPPEKREVPEAQDAHMIAQCAADPATLYLQHHNGAFKSSDRGRSWTELHVKPSSFGFAVAAHPEEPGTAWFVPAVKDETRVPVGAKMVVARTRDGGRTFQQLRKGLPQRHAYDLVYRHCLDVSADGKRLAAGSTTGSLWVTEDGGAAWTQVSAHLPPVYCLRFKPPLRPSR